MPLSVIVTAENIIHHILTADMPAILNPTGHPTSNIAAMSKYNQANEYLRILYKHVFRCLKSAKVLLTYLNNNVTLPQNHII